MKKYEIEVDENLDSILKANAQQANIKIEKLIVSILSRYSVSSHILESEQVKKAYAECGDVNLDWANL